LPNNAYWRPVTRDSQAVGWRFGFARSVAKLALRPDSDPNLFSCARLGDQLNSTFGDIRDFATVKQAVAAARPGIVFHLAAQQSVSRGFADPLEMFASNVIGTAHVLEARLHPDVKAVVCVTTTKRTCLPPSTSAVHRALVATLGRAPSADARPASYSRFALAPVLQVHTGLFRGR
jgi:nucleoside-diphosphate-sugar epimerase